MAEPQSTTTPPTHSSDPSSTMPPSDATTKKAPSSRPSSITKTGPTPVTKKLKRSFWSSLIEVLIPCASPKSTSRAHDIELDGASEGKKTITASNAGNVSATDPKFKSTGLTSDSPSTNPSTKPDPSTPAKGKVLPTSLNVPLVTATPIEQDGDVLIVPPSPSSHLLPRDETEGVTSGAVQPPGSTGDATFTTDIDNTDADHQHHTSQGHHHQGSTIDDALDMEIEDEDAEEERLILAGGTGIPIGPDGKPQPLLPPMSEAHKGRKCLVLDLDETLLHSSFKLIPQADFVVPVEIEWQWHNVYVIKRPGVDQFLKKMGELYEIVIFTASLSKYADPVLDRLDIHKVVSHRLFRESCYNHKGNYVKDLSRLGRPVEDMIILDNSPASYIFHPNNAVPVSSWFNDPHDTELTDLCPFLADLMHVEDVRGVLDGGI